MKALYNLFLILALATLSSAYTFLMMVEYDANGEEPYVNYKGRKYYLSDEPGQDSSTFLERNCVIYLDLSKTDDSSFRSGNAICKSMIPESYPQYWDDYVAGRLSKAN
ncbi:unnamed protein product [Hymenolepis diminuta]|uniref:Uncharacterized protein n=1 Tax=Hymenolepis diminuta TaxID=6216 RepID=A0A564Z1E4_HYMDI|nr:unnamed protein product [Hymenolepis diminuta]